ncbi:MAG: SMC-Scp complex subunit ScpB [Alphaproteobacteria bacterium]|nr:SMC-Scp complex subunit ScpB [Myxococcales bacterium]MCB9667918.1 SMC-Scp complex subunit ScpB [Alphaproteobacteria bacterium]MCB9690572.1 SMC-Scp complex subunit ScpB [Alphaproteobacteria bacterium]
MSDEILLFPTGSGVDPELVAVVEALLFATGKVMRVEDLAAVLPEQEPRRIVDALRVLGDRCASEDRGVKLVEVAGGWQMRSDERFATVVAEALSVKPVRLSRAALEVLAVIAWEQPATKQDVDQVRGVDSGATVRKLLEQGLIRVAGRRDIPGRPLEYRTTRAFLQLFSLSDLGSLPTLADAEELAD